MASGAPDDEKVPNMNNDSPNDLDTKSKDPESLRGENEVNLDAIADPDAGLSEQEREKRV
jgi:hypothetical protein